MTRHNVLRKPEFHIMAVRIEPDSHGVEFGECGWDSSGPGPTTNWIGH